MAFCQKKLIRTFFVFTIFLNYFHLAFTQVQLVDDSSIRELKFVSENKLLNQFIKRFNGEENINGIRLYPGDSLYRSKKIRKVSFDMLFDYSIKDKVKRVNFSEMKKIALSKKKPYYLGLHKGDIISELNIEVDYKKKVRQMTLFLKLQKEKIGSKWVIFHVVFPEYDREFNFDHDQTTFFLHPLSHEIGFINIVKALEQNEYVELLVDRGHESVDHLSLFLSHIKNGEMTVFAVGEQKFHIFQFPGFYMNVNYVSRNGNNVGWLIQDIVKGTPAEMKALKEFILYK